MIARMAARARSCAPSMTGLLSARKVVNQLSAELGELDAHVSAVMGDVQALAVMPALLDPTDPATERWLVDWGTARSAVRDRTDDAEPRLRAARLSWDIAQNNARIKGVRTLHVGRARDVLGRARRGEAVSVRELHEALYPGTELVSTRG